MRVLKWWLAEVIWVLNITVMEVFEFNPVDAAIAIGQTHDITQFADRDHFATYNNTNPIKISSNNRIVHQLSRHENRNSTTRSTSPRSPKFTTYTHQNALTTTTSSP